MLGSMRGRNQSGHTLVEVVAVAVVLGMLAALATVRSNDLSANAYADAETLKGMLRATRTRALADITPWTLTVAGQTATLTRNGTTKDTVTFVTSGVTAGATTFDTLGQATGTLSYPVADYSGGSVTIISGTGFVP